MEYGTLLRRALAKRGMSVAELAEKSGVPKRSLMAYSNGNMEPAFSRMVEICDALLMTVSDFIENDKVTVTVQVDKFVAESAASSLNKRGITLGSAFEKFLLVIAGEARNGSKKPDGSNNRDAPTR